MNPIKEIYFFGNNYKIAQTLRGIADLRMIICEKRAFNRDIYNFAQLHAVRFETPQTQNDLDLVLSKKRVGSLGVSHGFGIIFQKRHIQKFTYGIWNIHPGALPENRGRHPISWDFLKNRHYFTISIHEISEEIDRGFLLATAIIPRDLKYTEKEVQEKLEELLETGLMKKAVHNYFSGRKKTLGIGVYNPNLINRFTRVSPKDYESRFLFNLFKAQAKYGGVIIGRKRYRECAFYHPNYLEFYKDYKIFSCKDGKKIALK